MILPCLYRDDHLVVIQKPAGLLVHPTKVAKEAKTSVVQHLREQLRGSVFPVHRLDRGTSGVMLLALSQKSARNLSEQFQGHRVEKTYMAVVRGVPPKSVELDYPLKEELDSCTDKHARVDKEAKAAVTRFERLAESEVPVSVDRYPTTRYSLVRAVPITGRKHQIRRHLKHMGHPIVGDVNYGSGKHNRFFRETFGCHQMLLSCVRLVFSHPETGERVTVSAPPSAEFQAVASTLGWARFNHICE